MAMIHYVYFIKYKKKKFLIRADMTPQLDSSLPPRSHYSLTKSLNPLRQTSHEGPPGTDGKVVLAVGLCSTGSAELLVLNKSSLT